MTAWTKLDQPRTFAGVGGAIGAGLVVLYIVIIVWEGNNPAGQIAAWSVAMGIPTVLALASIALPPRLSRWTLLVATILFAPLMVLTSLSVGFLVAAAFTGFGAYKANESLASSRHQ